MNAPPEVGARAMGDRKRIALIAHDHRKDELLEWAGYKADVLSRHELYGTGTTGGMVACNRATADFVLSSPLMAASYRGPAAHADLG